MRGNPYGLTPTQKADLKRATSIALGALPHRRPTDVWLSTRSGLGGVTANALESRGLIRDRRRRGVDAHPTALRSASLAGARRLADRDYARLNERGIAEGKRLLAEDEIEAAGDR